MKSLDAAWLGRIDYASAYALQRALADARADGHGADTLLVLEHDPVYTLGRRATDAEVLLDAAQLKARGIAVEHTDRGGRVTYHGPGQLVGYPIVDLGVTGDLVGYVRALERALISTCASFGIEATTIDGLTGVWTGDEKIAQIGVHVSRGVTTHGFALNVSCDLGAFGGIVPCGITDKGVTSIEKLTGTAVPLALAAARAAEFSAHELHRELTWRDASVIAARASEASARA
jgi:lipoyl(octanoyl) transferase